MKFGIAAHKLAFGRNFFAVDGRTDVFIESMGKL